jgi:hypothetical protein
MLSFAANSICSVVFWLYNELEMSNVKSKMPNEGWDYIYFVSPYSRGPVLSIERCMECTLTTQHPINDRAQRIHYLTFGF